MPFGGTTNHQLNELTRITIPVDHFARALQPCLISPLSTGQQHQVLESQRRSHCRPGSSHLLWTFSSLGKFDKFSWVGLGLHPITSCLPYPAAPGTRHCHTDSGAGSPPGIIANRPFLLASSIILRPPHTGSLPCVPDPCLPRWSTQRPARDLLLSPKPPLPQSVSQFSYLDTSMNVEGPEVPLDVLQTLCELAMLPFQRYPHQAVFPT